MRSATKRMKKEKKNNSIVDKMPVRAYNISNLIL
jgi:hypothetical protein